MSTPKLIAHRMSGASHMDNGMNGPIMAMSFFAGVGLSFNGILTSLLAAIAVGVIAKGFDRGAKILIAYLNNHWRREARRLEKRVKELERAEQRSRS